jgi:hypothetical protein
MRLSMPTYEADEFRRSFKDNPEIGPIRAGRRGLVSVADALDRLPGLPPQVDFCDALVDLFHGDGAIAAQYLRGLVDLNPAVILTIADMLDPKGTSTRTFKMRNRRLGKPRGNADELYSLGSKVHAFLPTARNKIDEAVKLVVEETRQSRTKVYRGWRLFNQSRKLLDKY